MGSGLWLAGATAALAMPSPMAAQTVSPDLSDEVRALRAEVEALRAELQAMRAAPAATQSAAQAPALPPPAAAALARAPEPAPAANAPATPPARPASPVPVVAFKGAPEIRSEGGWSFKPRGRLQIDAAYLDAGRAPTTTIVGGRGIAEVRRLFLGAQGTIPGGFSYRADIDFAPATPQLSEAYLAYDTGPLNITLGQVHPFTGIEQQTSDLFTAFTERASFIGAFNQRRRLGLAASLSGESWTVGGGVFADNIAELRSDGVRSVSVDARAVWMPRLGETQFHLAASAHQRHVSTYPDPTITRYRARPYVRATDLRPIETEPARITDETSWGVEAAIIRGPLHAVGEGWWLRARPLDNDYAPFFGGYAEVGLFLTGDRRGYRDGAFDRTVPNRPITAGGIGAVELNLRYDYLDIDEGSVRAGRQNALGGSLIWNPTAYVRFTVDYVHHRYRYRALLPDARIDVAAARAQVDF